jgi:Piezo non-specific cation channel, R-Ras-binding domain
MLTSTSMDIWQWFKFESIYEQLYTDIIEIASKKDIVPGLKLSTASKMALGLGLAFAQIFLLICPFIFFGKYSSQKNKVQLAGVNIDLLTGNTKNSLYSGLTAWSIRDMGKLR